MMDLARVQKELNECNRDVQVSGIRVSLKADSLTHLIGSIPGPQGTPYEGGVFKIDITLPGNFFFFFSSYACARFVLYLFLWDYF